MAAMPCEKADTASLAGLLAPFERRVFVVVGSAAGSSFSAPGPSRAAVRACFDLLNSRLGRSNWCAVVPLGELPLGGASEDDSAATVAARAHAEQGVSCVFVGGSGLRKEGGVALAKLRAAALKARGHTPGDRAEAGAPLGSHPADAERKPLFALCCAQPGEGDDGAGGVLLPGPCLVGRRRVLAQLSGVVVVGGVGALAQDTAAALAGVAGLPLHVCRGCVDTGAGAAGLGAWLAARRAAGAESGAVPLPGRVTLADTPAMGTAHAGGAMRSSASGAGVVGRVEDGWTMTMHQPWASLVMTGIKRAEGRVWGADFRGWLWIHAGGKPPMQADVEAIEAMYREVYAEGDPRPGKASLPAQGDAALAATPRPLRFPTSYPTGCLLGCVYIAGMASNDEYQRLRGRLPPSVTAESESPFVFLCERPRRLASPVTMRGQHKLWRLAPRAAAAEYAAGLLPVEAPQPVCFPLDHAS